MTKKWKRLAHWKGWLYPTSYKKSGMLPKRLTRILFAASIPAISICATSASLGQVHFGAPECHSIADLFSKAFAIRANDDSDTRNEVARFIKIITNTAAKPTELLRLSEIANLFSVQLPIQAGPVYIWLPYESCKSNQCTGYLVATLPNHMNIFVIPFGQHIIWYPPHEINTLVTMGIALPDSKFKNFSILAAAEAAGEGKQKHLSAQLILPNVGASSGSQIFRDIDIVPAQICKQ